jgi:hypothetical protein
LIDTFLALMAPSLQPSNTNPIDLILLSPEPFDENSWRIRPEVGMDGEGA